MNKINCVCISGDRFQDRFMRTMGVFDSGKALAEPTEMTLTLKPDCTIAKAMSDVRMMTEKSGHRVIAVFSPGNPEGAWRDTSVRLVSNGMRACLLDDMLKVYDFVESEVTDDT